jgi:DNA-binding MarR family transcriptional regulator
MSDIIQIQLFQNLRRIIRAIEIYSKKVKSNYDVTPIQILCMQTIQETGPMTLASLAKMTYVSASTLVGVIDRLEDRELLKRERSQKDRRYTFIYLTEKGQEQLKVLPPALHAKLTEGIEKLDQDELREIVTALDKIVSLIEAEDVDAAPVLDTGSLG